MFVFLFLGALVVTSNADIRPGGIPNSTYVASKDTWMCPLIKEEGSDGSSDKVRILGSRGYLGCAARLLDTT